MQVSLCTRTDFPPCDFDFCALCLPRGPFFLGKLSSTGVLHATAHCRRIWPSPAFPVLVVANGALHPHHPAMVKQVPHEPAKGHLATFCLQPWMARAHPLAHAAPAAAGLRAGHQSVSLKHGSNSFQVARLRSQHSGVKRIAFFLTTARKLLKPHVIFNYFFF